MKARFYVALALLAVGSAQTAAQERDVARRTFTFLDRNLTIQVVSEGAGALHVVRGEPGIVEVAARAPEGFAGFAMGGREENELRLTAVGGNRVDYMVAVPEDVRVRVLLPGRQHMEIASTRPAMTYNWAADGAGQKSNGAAAIVAPNPDGMFVSYHAYAPPRVLSIPDAGAVTKLDVRFEGSEFKVATSRAVDVTAGRSDAINFNTGREPIAIVVTAPQNARDFQLVIAGKTALEARGGELHSYCDQVIAQQLPDGRRYYSYAPAEGLVCR
ncbi:MAG TPA: hypothetical protein VK864_16400 [Longimicrobiales bacterium]|nr:hypothetical protein [Longimicrobiales bacterium]